MRAGADRRAGTNHGGTDDGRALFDTGIRANKHRACDVGALGDTDKARVAAHDQIATRLDVNLSCGDSAVCDHEFVERANVAPVRVCHPGAYVCSLGDESRQDLRAKITCPLNGNLREDRGTKAIDANIDEVAQRVGGGRLLLERGDPTGLVRHDDTKARHVLDAFDRQRCECARCAMRSRQCREIDRVETIAACDEKDVVVREQRLLALAGSTGRAEQLWLDRVRDRNPVGGTVTEHLHDRLGAMVEVDHGARAAGGRNPAQQVLDDRTVAHGRDRLWQVVSQRTQSRPESGGHNHHAHLCRVAG